MIKLNTAKKIVLVSLALASIFLFGFKHRVYATDPPSGKIDFTQVDPLQIAGNKNVLTTGPSLDASNLNTPGKLVSRALTYAFPIAGTILFVMILWGGFEMISGATESKSMEAGKQRITAAVLGFLLLFAAYWITQLVQIVFNVSILGS